MDPSFGTFALLAGAFHKEEAICNFTKHPLTKGRPIFRDFPGDFPQLGKLEAVKKIVVKIPVEGTARLGLVPTGYAPEYEQLALNLQHPRNQLPPGDFSLVGPYVLVNNQVWHYSQQSVYYWPAYFLPLRGADGNWSCNAIRIQPADDEIATQEGEIQIGTTEEGHPFITITSPRNDLGAPMRADYRVEFSVTPPEKNESGLLNFLNRARKTLAK